MGIRYGNWPFDTEETVRLHWLRSPYHVGEAKQWQMQAVFKRRNGDLTDVAVPWGALPSFRLGRSYRAGKPTEESPLGTSETVRFCSNPRVRIERAAAVPRSYELRTKMNLEERCVVVWSRGETIVVPCLEVIRAYFAPNRMMTSELLGPDLFSEVCSASLADGQASLQFTERVSTAALSPDVVLRMALVLFDREFQAAWRSVWISVNPQGGADIRKEEPAHPLIVDPPCLPGSSWTVRCLRFGQITLVLEIEKFKPAVSLPFTAVSYEHPRFHVYEGGKKLGGGTLTLEDPEETVVSSEPKPPKGLTSPYAVQIGITTADLSRAIEVIKIREPVAAGALDGDSPIGSRLRKESVSTKDGTLYEEAGTGELPSVEFVPFAALSQVTANFRNFFKALHLIQGETLAFFEGAAPEGCCLPCLPKTSGNPRPYVLVCVSGAGRKFFLLEVDGSDGHGISTLVFARPRESPASQQSAEHLLKKGTAGSGHWDRDRLRALLGVGKFELLRHTRSSADAWAYRLKKAGYLVAY